jgi:hypothetical protein
MLALCAFICILVVVFTTVGLTVLDEWEFNNVAYFNYMMMYVLSTNYTVLIALNFAHCPYPSRIDRLSYATSKSGSAIMWCFFQSILISICMMFSKQAMVNQFAKIILLTNLFSMLVSLTLFGSLACLFYPCLNEIEIPQNDD